MKYLSDAEFARRLTRHDGFWAGETSLISVTAPLLPHGSSDLRQQGEQAESSDLWRSFTDPELIHERDAKAFSETYFAGDALPISHFFLGATGYAAFIKGVRYKLRGSLWIQKTVEELSGFFPVLDENSELYQSEMNIIRFYEENAPIGYLVGNPDNAGVFDVLSLMRGAEEMMCDLCLEPEEVLRVLHGIQEIWETVTARTLPRIKKINSGRTCVGWLHITAPGTVAQMQCDASVMISPEMFSRFCMPELERQCQLLEHPLYHLDGIEQVRFLDDILSLERLETIQWTCVAGQPGPLENLDALRRIQRAGKRIIILSKKEEAHRLAAELDDGPILLHFEADSVAEADDAVASLIR